MASTNLLQTFWGLSSNEEKERIGAAKDLLVLLDQQQSSTHEGVCPELEYAVQRLVKGLASNRKGARHGFYTALVQILVQFPQLSVKAVLKLVHTHLEPSSSAKSAEERGTCFGKGFALMALTTSGVLATEDEFVSVAKQLVGLVKRKSFLGEFCGVVMCELVSRCPQDLCKAAGLLTALGVEGGWELATPEILQVMFHLNKLYCKEKWFIQFLHDHWNTKHMWSHKNFDLMKPSLMVSSSALPRLHGVWPLVLEAVRSRGHFKQWWLTVVDDGLVMSSHERKYLSFQLLACVLPVLCPAEVGVVLSPNLLVCLVNNSRSSGNYLYSIARHLLGELSSCVKTINNQRLLTSLFLHLQRRTNSKFDQLTGSKVVELIISKINLDGVDLLLNTFQQLFAGTPLAGTLGEERCEEQLWALEQMVGVVRNTHLCRAGTWLISAATLLLGHAFFTLSSSCTTELPPPLTPTLHPMEPSVQRSCQLRFFSVLTDLSNLSLPHTDQGGVAWGRPHMPAGIMENGQCFVSTIFQVAEQLIAMGSGEGVELAQPFTSEEQVAWDLSCSAVQTLRSGSEVADKAFLLLYSVASLGLLPSEERDVYCQTIMELEACRSELACVHKTRTPAKKRKCQESKWMQVLTDMLLGFLSRPSQLWRNTVEQVFRLLTNHVTSECLQLILAVLKPKQPVEDVMEEGKEEDEDVMEEGKEEDEDTEDDDDSDSGEGSEGEGGGVDPAFAEEVRRALGAAAAVGSDGESEASLDDDAMLAVDEALGEVFRTRFALKHQKKLKKDDEKSLLHFKLRVLDLVELFLQKEPSNPLIFDLITPLYELIQAAQSTKSHAPLVERAGGIFRNRLCHAKVYPKAGLDWTALHDQIHQFVQCLYKANATTSPLVTAGCMFLIRVLRGCVVPPHVSPLTTRAGRKRKIEKCEKGEESPEHGRLDVALVTGWLSDALHDFITVKNSNVPPSFFTTYIQRYPGLACLLVPTMAQDLPNAANHFKKTRVCEMMAVLSSGEGVADGQVWAGLSEEDAAAIHTVMDKYKGGKRKRSKRK